MAKINLKRGLTDIVLYLIIFIVVQIIVMYAGAGIWAGIKGEGYQATLLAISSGSNPILMALTSAFSNVITLVIFLKTKWTPLTRDYLLSKPWATLLWVALFALGTIIPLEFIYEQIGIEMDENARGIFFDEYVKAIKETGNVWAVPVIDLNSLSGLFPLYDAGAQMFNKPDIDRLHPNDAGHSRMAKTIMQQLSALPCVF